MQPCNIAEAAQVQRYALRLKFEDGTERIVDFEPLLVRARHPQIRAFLDPRAFAEFRIEYGELIWGDYELCFPVIDLYTGDILNTRDLAAAA